MAGLVFAAACQDVPTAPAPVAEPSASVALNQGLHAGQVPVVCSLGSARVSALGFDWYRRQDTLYVPRANLDPAGRTVEYKFAAVNPNGLMAFGANCPAVPYTENALRRIDKRFLVREGGGAQQFRDRQGGITIQCVRTEQGCLLESITVVATPETDQPEMEPCDYDPAACWGDFGEGGGGGGGYGGGDGTQCMAGDLNCDGSTGDDGPGAFAICVVAYMGLDGAAALASAGWSSYQLYDLRRTYRAAINRFYEYTNQIGHPGYDPFVAELYQQAAVAARKAEEDEWVKLGGAGTYLTVKLGFAVKTCLPALALPRS